MLHRDCKGGSHAGTNLFSVCNVKEASLHFLKKMAKSSNSLSCLAFKARSIRPVLSVLTTRGSPGPGVAKGCQG